VRNPRVDRFAARRVGDRPARAGDRGGAARAAPRAGARAGGRGRE
ncbi:MAG: hypothetical protein AVDCRST_MAG64-3390, partial [uncultured Phycisphaerae bacterium]